MVIEDTGRKILFDWIQRLKINIQDLSSIVQNPINIQQEDMVTWMRDRDVLNKQLDEIEYQLKQFVG